MADTAAIAPSNAPASLPGSAMIRIENGVIVWNGTRVLDGLNLMLGRSGVTSIMGPNGAGKTVLLRVIAGLVELESGARHVADTWRNKHDIALVFQRPVLLRRSVRANLVHALTAYGVPRADRAALTHELLDKADLANHADRPARALSGGEQQRLALVRALAAKPKLLVLDEPTASLDPHATAKIETLIRDTARKGIRVLLVTHDQGQARRLADEIVFLHRGRVTEYTPASEFFDSPKSAEARAYLSGDLLI